MLREEGPELGGGRLRARLGPEGGEARDVRRRHARSREALAAQGHGEGGEDVDARGDEVDLPALRHEAAVGEVAELHARVERADGEDGGAVGRVAHGRVPAAAAVALVARGGDDERALREGALADGLEDVAVRVVHGDLGPERHGDDARALRERPLEPREDLAVGPAPLVAEDLAREDGRLARDAVPRRVVRLARAARGADAVRAVAVAVLRGPHAGDEARRLDGARGEVGVAKVEAGVEDGDLHSLAGGLRERDAGGLEAPRVLGLRARGGRRAGRAAAGGADDGRGAASAERVDAALGLDGEDARGVLLGGDADAGRPLGVARVDVDEGDAEALEEDGVGPGDVLGRERPRADVEGRGHARAGGPPEGGHGGAHGAFGEEDEEAAGEVFVHRARRGGGPSGGREGGGGRPRAGPERAAAVRGKSLRKKELRITQGAR